MTFEMEFSDDSFLGALSTDFKTTSEIMKAVGCSRTLAKKRLGILESKGLVERSHAPASGKLKYKEVWRLRSEQGAVKEKN